MYGFERNCVNCGIAVIPDVADLLPIDLGTCKWPESKLSPWLCAGFETCP